MPSIACPQCKTKLVAPAEVLGQSVRCVNCGGQFTASTSQSPYLEGLPSQPRDRRPLLLAGGVVLSLLLVTGLVLISNSMQVEMATLTPGVVLPEQLPTAEPPRKPAMTTADGTPIELPDGDGPDRMPPPGEDYSPAVRKALGRDTKTPDAPKAKSFTLDDVTLTGIKWNTVAKTRTLDIGYSFRNGSGPVGNLYTLKLRFNGAVTLDWPMSVVLPASDTLSIPTGAGDSLPRVEVWVERSVAGGLAQKVSNTLTLE